jgi:hypothetical protein
MMFMLHAVPFLQMLLELIKPIIIKPDQISGSRGIAQGSFGSIFSAIYNKRRVAVKRINKVCGAPAVVLWKAGSCEELRTEKPDSDPHSFAARMQTLCRGI